MHHQNSSSALKRHGGRISPAEILAAVMMLIVSLLFGLNALPRNIESWRVLNSFSTGNAQEVLAQDTGLRSQDSFWLAQALNTDGKYEEALAVLLASEPESIHDRSFKAFALCEAYANLGFVNEAVQSCVSIDALHHLASVGRGLLQTNKPADAAVLFAAVFEKQPALGITGLVNATFTIGTYDIAERALRIVIAKYPDNARHAEWQLLLGTALSGNGKFSEAADVYRTIIRDNPADAEAHFLLAEAVYEVDGFSAAQTIIESGIQLDPASPRGPALMGDLLSLEGRFEEADGFFLKAVALSDETNVSIRLQAADNAFKGGDYPAAIARYNAILEAFHDQLDAEARSNTEYLLGLSYAGNGEPENAMAIAERIVSTRPGNASALLQAARIQEQAGAPDLAILSYENVLRVNPAEEAAVLNLVRLLVAKADLAEAAGILEQAISQPGLAHRSREWRFWLGQILVADNRFSDAQGLLESFIEDYPADAEAFFLLGKAVYQTEGITAATAIIEAGISLDPNSPQGPIALGDILVSEGLRDEADRYYLEAVRLSADTDYWIRIKAANNAFYAKQYPIAIDRFIGVLDLYRDRLPGNVLGNVLYLLGSAYALEGNRSEALAIVEAYLATNPDDPQVLAQSGRIYELTGADDQAIEFYKQALELDPSIELAVNGLKRLVGPDG